MPEKNHHRTILSITSLLLIFSLISACISQLQLSPEPTATPINQTIFQAEVVFNVTIPANTPPGQFVNLDILDEVTGLGLNPLRYSMKPDDPTHYSIHLPVVIGSVLKYRYGRDSDPPAVEYTAGGKQVRYRMVYITGTKTIQDTITAWNDVPYHGTIGRINGQVVDKKSNVPEPNVLVAAGGLQTLTASDGTFLLDGLQPGIHNMVIYSLDGTFEPFQQEALIAENSMTPVPVSVEPANKVKVTFIAHPPSSSPRGIPVRMVGNILALGNTYSDLGGGMNVIASRAPLMSVLPDGTYGLTLELPTGLDLRYKYSLGDGFWNSELTGDGQFELRQLLVPGHDITVDDQVEAWQTKDFGAVTFNLKVSAAVPQGETISIQFNPYGWTEPIPMWPLGNGQWFYVLYNPLQLLDAVSYRFCRNDQCGIADANNPGDSKDLGFSPQTTPQTINQEITQWVWWQPSSTPITLVAPSIQARQPGFVAGVEMLPQYRPSWLPYFPATLKDIQTIHANWAVLSPTWTFTSQNPPILEPVAGKDIIWQDMINQATQVKQNNLGLAIFPKVDFGPNSEGWWASAQKDAGWWQSWFDRYREFILNYADLAEQVKANALILGDPEVQPALPGAKIADVGPVISSPDAENRWTQLIKDVRLRFKGKLIWAVSMPGNLSRPPDFLDSVDEIYVLISAAIGENDKNGSAGFIPQIESLFDGDIHSLKVELNKPILIGIDYPSATGAEKGCITSNGGCMAFSQLDPPYTDDFPSEINLQEQVDIYHAFLTVINTRDWVDGFISRSYYPPVPLQDKSSSVHGKQAADVLWYWFSQMLPAK